MERIIEVSNLKKNFRHVQAVRGISFFVETGKCFAFLGSDGAGKSTGMDMLATVLRPDAGQVWVNGFTLGKEDRQIRRILGVVFQDGLLDETLTVGENLRCRGALYGLRGKSLRNGVEAALRAVGVWEDRKKQYRRLPPEERRRCDIARALVHQPPLLLLDEVAEGLDPSARRRICRLIREIQQSRGMTMLLATRHTEEAAQTDYLMVLDKGQIAARGTPAALREAHTRDWLKLTCQEPEKVKAILAQGVHRYRQHGNQFTVELSRTLEALPILQAVGEGLIQVEIIPGTLDEAFLNITEKEMLS